MKNIQAETPVNGQKTVAVSMEAEFIDVDIFFFNFFFNQFIKLIIF